MNYLPVYTACVTPFYNSGEVDYESFEKILRFQDQSGNGILLLGSTGENLSLLPKEREQIVLFALSLKLLVPIVVGAPCHNRVEALSWLDFCEDHPLDGYLFTTPMYLKPGVRGQTLWFEKMLGHVTKPCILYNIPGRSSVPLYPEVLKNIQDHKNCWALKDSSGSIESLVNYQRIAAKVPLYCGDDYLVEAMCAVGAVGLISVASNVWPVQAKRFVEAKMGKKNAFSSLLWFDACQSLFKASNPVPIKALMKEVGLITSDYVRLPLSQEDLLNLDDLLMYHRHMEEL